MNFFGIGPMELVFILILALIIFGPGRLPEIGRAVGKSIRDFRAMTQEVTSQFSLELEESTKAKEPQKAQAPAPTPAEEAPAPTEPPAPEAAAPDALPLAEAAEAAPQEGAAQEPEAAEGTREPSPSDEVAG
jgi:TatA/E family protein of Tat protein translocase